MFLYKLETIKNFFTFCKTDALFSSWGKILHIKLIVESQTLWFTSFVAFGCFMITTHMFLLLTLMRNTSGLRLLSKKKRWKVEPNWISEDETDWHLKI